MTLAKTIYQDQKTREFLRFCVVGGICTLIDAAVYYFLKIYVYYLIALISGYGVGLIFNYILTTYWTFKSKPTKKNLLGTVGAHLVNCFVIRTGTMYLFVTCMSINNNIAYVLMLFISVPVNFIMVRYFFKK